MPARNTVVIKRRWYLKRKIVFLLFFLTLNIAGYCGQASRSELRGADSAPGSSVQSGNLTLSQVDAYGQKIMSNPDNAAIIENLAKNPRIQALAQDPEIIQAIKSGNIQALQENKKFSDVVNSPETQEAMKDIKQ